MSDTGLRCRPEPCEGCPYRRDVPSGVWTREEYNKLELYDAPTWAQPPEWFGCHAAPNLVCSGWAQVHGKQKDDTALLARRFFWFEIPPETVPLMRSGREAARHGRARITRPGKRAMEMVRRLMGKHSRLRTNPHNAPLILEED